MSAQKNICLTLTLLAVTLTLAQSCRFLPGYVCAPDQYYCTRRGGKCSIVGGRCACVPARQFYGYPSGYNQRMYENYDAPSYETRPDMYGRPRVYIEPESSRNPMSESNMEQRTNMMVHMTRMYRMMNRIMT